VTAFLELAGIRKAFGSFTALENVDLAIERASSSASSGPSGCGKTTLLRIIAGLEAQTAGRITMAGRDISTLPPAQRDYGIVFQSYALFPNLSVADNVAYGLVNRKVAAPRPGPGHRAAGPGGPARQRGQVPGAAVRRPAAAHRARARAGHLAGLLLLDEPLSALDAIVRVHLRGEIRSLQRKLGVTTIMVTHDQEEALSVADRIVVMNHGVIEQVGTPQQVYREPASRLRGRLRGPHQRLPPHASRPLAARRAAPPSNARHARRRAAMCASTCGPRTCWRGRSRRATATSSRPDREDRVPGLVLPGAVASPAPGRPAADRSTCR
jgi:iron(III) transport system ATP-binding protein